MEISLDYQLQLKNIDRINQDALAMINTDLGRAASLSAEARQDAQNAMPPYQFGIAQANYVQCCVQFYQSNVPASFEGLQTVIATFRQLDHKPMLARSMTLLSAQYRLMGDYPNALSVAQEQYDLYLKLDDPVGQVRALNGIGGIYHALETYQDEIETLLKCEDLLERHGSPNERTTLYSNLGRAFARVGALKSALEYGQKAVAIAREHGSIQRETEAALSLGETYTTMGDYAEAEKLLTRALELALQNQNINHQISVLNNLSEHYRQSSRYEQALDYAEQTIALLEDHQSEKSCFDVYHTAARALRALGRHEEAYARLETYHRVRNAVFTERSDERLTVLETRYKTQTALRETEFYQQRNRELEQLRESDKLYFERLGQLKDELLNTASHNLKSPLSTINTAVFMLSRQPAPQTEPTHKYLQTIAEQTKSMTRLIAEVLELAKLETRRALQVQRYPLSTLLRDSIDGLELMALQKGIALELVPAPDLMIECDAGLIAQAVHHLVSNGLKYTGTGGRVSLSAEAVEDRVRFTITDTGIGIPPESIPYIFQRFFRVPEHRSLTEGTGLGLSIVQVIVEQHGGTVRVQSEVGKGSRFTIDLPQTPPR